MIEQIEGLTLRLRMNRLYVQNGCAELDTGYLLTWRMCGTKSSVCERLSKAESGGRHRRAILAACVHVLFNTHRYTSWILTSWDNT